MIKPRALSGFPEYLPAQQLAFNRVLSLIRSTYEAHGFTPIETPSVEHRDVLTAKGADDAEIYALTRLNAGPDERDTDLALHFDLSVPLARYVAQHESQLVFPFQRSQIQKVWRGERPQAGRYREFYQADIDVIGRGSLSLLYDAVLPAVVSDALTRLNIGPFCIRLNNRQVLQGYFESLGLAPVAVPQALRILDRLEKVGIDRVRQDFTTLGVSPDTLTPFLDLVTSNLASDALLSELAGQARNALFDRGVTELHVVLSGLRDLGVPEANFQVDLSIARGLGYYTGTVYETKLLNFPGLGSICSGGRYENLVGHFHTGTFPGVGLSIGVSRFVPALLEAGVLSARTSTTAQVLVTLLQPEHQGESLRLGAELRSQGVSTEVYLEPHRLGQQLRYADRKGFRLAVMVGDTELQAGQVRVKDLQTGEESLLSRAQWALGIWQRLSNAR
ncbi:histidine--tRNA ligase [Deinococcus aquatilis]|uniref:histidine--tRNA ligase n=1 Tax=Deinococcus aquatilis TaxID=519440 RepID=UPI00037593BF|nr:histidine--tRNA ligase [Deinococcus aquatilis]